MKFLSSILILALAATVLSSQVQESIWDLSSTTYKMNGKDVVLRGMNVGCGEYFLRAVGMKCWSKYDWPDSSAVIATPDPNLLDAMRNIMIGTSEHNSIPSIRITINAGYYLGVVTSEWSANNDRFVDLAGQYRTALDGLVQNFTGEGAVVILDLHWNSDLTGNYIMAMAGDNTTGDSIQFWDMVAQKYADNSMVWYELYNEPHLNDYDTYANGNGSAGLWGYKPMYDTVRKYTNNPVVIAGNGYAYNYEYQVQFYNDYQPVNVAYNFHPYMQNGQPESKNAVGFLNQVQQLQSAIGKPVIVTEFGSKCSPQGGEAWYYYPGNYNGVNMSYTEAIMTIAEENSVSWNKWQVRPLTLYGDGGCGSDDALNNSMLIGTVNGTGADLQYLWPKFY